MHQSLFPYHPERDVYRLLQVAPTATSEEIQAACRHLARRFHPDHNRSPRATEEMQVVNAVRDLLTDPPARAAYDRARYRFLATRAAPRPPVPVVQAFTLTPGRAAVVVNGSLRARDIVERTLRALVDAFRAVVAEFGPRRCPGCRELVEADYLFCATCGSPLRRAARLRGA